MADEFLFPWQYQFPPFFTHQPNIDTRAKQIILWKDLIVDYYRKKKMCILDIRELNDSELLSNETIKRTIDPELLKEVLQNMESAHYAEPLDKTKNRWIIYWHSMDEFAGMIHAYIQSSNNVGSVLTIYELTEGDDVADTEFYQLGQEVMIRLLRRLESEGKCELMLYDEHQGVKFF